MADPLDPIAAERVLRRANELAGQDADDSDGIDPDVLVDAATDVGIPERAMRQSLAIERLGPPPDPGRFDRLVGPAAVTSQRAVGASPEESLELLDRWLVKSHQLRRVRRGPSEVEWMRRDDMVANAQRFVRGLAGEARLGSAPSVRAAAHPIEGSDSVVRVSVDRAGHRRHSLLAGGVLTTGGAVAVGFGVLVAAPVAVAAVPAVIAAVAVTSSARTQAGRYEREVERVLDAVAEQRPPSKLFGRRRRSA